MTTEQKCPHCGADMIQAGPVISYACGTLVQVRDNTEHPGYTCLLNELAQLRQELADEKAERERMGQQLNEIAKLVGQHPCASSPVAVAVKAKLADEKAKREAVEAELDAYKARFTKENAENVSLQKEYSDLHTENTTLRAEVERLKGAESLLKEAVAILDDFQGYYCAEDSCPTVDEAYHNAAAFVAKIREGKAEIAAVIGKEGE